MAHSITQLVRVLNKLKNNNITEDKELVNISYDKLENLEGITEYEKLIILQYGAALKNHKKNIIKLLHFCKVAKRERREEIKMAFNQKTPPIKLTLDESFFNLMLEVLSNNEKVNVDQTDLRAKKLKEKLLKYPRNFENEDNVKLVSIGFFPNEASEMIDQLLVYLAVNYEIELKTDYYSILAESKKQAKEE